MLMRQRTKIAFAFLLLVASVHGISQTTQPARERLLMDFGWRFAFGHPYYTTKDFNHATSYFSYLTKAAYGDGAAAAGFDDRSWRKLDLPHDWAVEQSFSQKASFSHGFKAIGRAFPERSVGWYRKTFSIPATDLGRRISIAFDGVFRNSIVWVNGHFLGNEASGYLSFEFDITDYLNYGGENNVAVRVDATMEEGWFYEGAGIYRHVWLNKTNPLHVATDGSFVTTEVTGNSATVTPVITIKNDDNTAAAFSISQSLVDAQGNTVAKDQQQNLSLRSLEEKDFTTRIILQNPKLWQLENPHLYKLITTIIQDSKVVDLYITTFGIRTIRFDNNEGFFLNGKHVKIKGTNNHQDHAGVGSAMPDGLQEYRIGLLKAMGCNAYRCSHNPPTPELLEACDRLGMMVIDENRLMGTTQRHLSDVRRLILRDRNHPCIISWSIGNEEWGIENSTQGSRIAKTIEDYVKTLDTTRPVTYAFSGGMGQGISGTVEVLGVNYIMNKNTDEHHKKFPAQPMWGTEEGSTVATRGEYVTDVQKHYRAAYDEPQNKTFISLEQGWTHYATRPYLGGMFIWTGFDYRGEPTPFGWPSVTSLFGMMDICGFPKDNVWYLKSWWLDKPVLHLLPHWNWPDKKGQKIAVWAYSNCEEVELFLNKKSLGKKSMPRNGHLEWKVAYTPGTLEAIGYSKGQTVIRDNVQTTGNPTTVRLSANNTNIRANKEDISIVTVDVLDKNGLRVPVADNDIFFTVQGPAKIIGVGNGQPTSLEKDVFLPTIEVAAIENLKEKAVAAITNRAETSADYNDSGWQAAFRDDRTQAFGDTVKALVYRATFTMPELNGDETITFFYNSIGREQSIYINGKEIATNLEQEGRGNEFRLGASQIHFGINSIAIAATPILKKQPWDNINTNPGLFQIIRPAGQWKRKLFNGLAQVIIQSTGEEGEITLTATCPGIKPHILTIQSAKATMRPTVNE